MMAEQPPPPYTDRYVGYFKRNVPNETPPMTVSSTSQYSHKHEVYTVVIDFPNSRQYLWSPDLTTDGALTPIPSDFNPAENFGMVQGFQQFSRFQIARDLLQDPESVEQEVLDFLDRRIRICRSSDDQLSNENSSQVGTAPGDDALECHIYKIHLFSKYAQSLTDDTGPKASALLFRCTRSSSVYGDSRGSWELSLLDVIRNGKLGAGGQLCVHVRGVSEEQMERLRRQWQEGTKVLEF